MSGPIRLLCVLLAVLCYFLWHEAVLEFLVETNSGSPLTSGDYVFSWFFPLPLTVASILAIIALVMVIRWVAEGFVE